MDFSDHKVDNKPGPEKDSLRVPHFWNHIFHTGSGAGWPGDHWTIVAELDFWSSRVEMATRAEHQHDCKSSLGPQLSQEQ